MQTVILCGGMGKRMRDYSKSTPKPLVPIGDMPIIQHVMTIYAHNGFTDFILCLGHRGLQIINHFRALAKEPLLESNIEEGQYVDVKWNDWVIRLVNTGEKTNTGGRIKLIESHISGESFFVTYADGLADIDIAASLAFHKEKNKMITLTAINPTLRYGILEIDELNVVTKFKEKPRLDVRINGGFFVFNRSCFRHITKNDILEVNTLEKLVGMREIAAFNHDGFWLGMDTYKDFSFLNELWENKQASWIKME